MKTILLLAVNFLWLFSYSQTISISDGNWDTGSNWSSGVPSDGSTAIIINNMDLNTDLNINGGSYTVNNGSITDVNGGSKYDIDIRGGGSLDVDGNVYIEGDFELRNNGSTLTIRSGDTLTILGDFEQRNSSTLIIEEGGVLRVFGDYGMRNSSIGDIHGKISVSGSVVTRNNANISGIGNLESGGSVETKNSSVVFDNTGDCDSGPCEFGSGEGLPITLSSFSGEFISKTAVELTWTTSSELNNDFFTILYSESGKNFKSFKNINGAGNSNQELTYKTVINGVNSNEIYAQLKQTDFDGRFEIFDPIIIKQQLNIQNSITEEVGIYPNPGNGETIYVELENFEPNEYQIHILNENGQLLVNKEILVEEGTSYVEVELLKGFKLNRGLHFIRISSADTIITRKYIVN